MTSSFQSRLGTAPEEAIKAPCRVATTANITLSGTQTIDGIAVEVGDRVFVKDQTTGSEDGIYIVQTGSWTRAPDWDGPGDVVSGMLVPIVRGTISASLIYMVVFSGSFTVGSSSFDTQISVASFADLQSTDVGKGASLVSFEDGKNVQELRSEDAGDGASMIPFEDGKTVQDLRSSDAGKGASMILAEDGVSLEARLPVDNLKELVDATALQVDGLQVQMRAFYSDTDTGGGHFYWDAGRAKSDANGVTIIDPDNVGTLSATALGTFHSQQGTGSGTGCWVRLFGGFVEVTWAGTRGDGSTNDFAAIEAAGLVAASDTMYFPAPSVDYRITSTFKISTGTVMRGAGWSTTLRAPNLKVVESRDAGGTAQTDVHFRSMTFDCEAEAGTEFVSVLDLDDTKDCTVVSCRLLSSGSNSSEQNREGVLARLADDIFVQGNLFDETQCKVGAGNFGIKAERQSVVNNISRDAHDIAYTAVLTGIDNEILHLVISSNIAVNSSSAATIFFGADGSSTDASSAKCYDFNVSDNVIVGPQGRRLPLINGVVVGDSRNWVINDNVLDGVATANVSFGIIIRSSSTSPFINGLSIQGNLARTADMQGVNIATSGVGILVSDNYTANTRGIKMIGSTDHAGTIRANYLDGTDGGQEAIALFTTDTVVDITDNILNQSSPSFKRGAIDIDTATSDVITASVIRNTIIGCSERGINEEGSGTFNTMYAFNRFNGGAKLDMNVNVNALRWFNWSDKTGISLDTWVLPTSAEIRFGSNSGDIVPKSSGTTGGTDSAGAGNQYVELNVDGTVYKVLHDGTV